MPRYYFDVIDGGPQIDASGTDCRDDEAARRAAMRLLPDVAREEMPGLDRRTFSIVVRDDQKRAMYSMALSIIGVDLR